MFKEAMKGKNVKLIDERSDERIIRDRKLEVGVDVWDYNIIKDKTLGGQDHGLYWMDVHVEPGGDPYYIPNKYRYGLVAIPLDADGSYGEKYLKLELVRFDDKPTEVGTSRGLSVVCRGKVKLPVVYDKEVKRRVEFVKMEGGKCSYQGDIVVYLEVKTKRKRMTNGIVEFGSHEVVHLD